MLLSHVKVLSLERIYFSKDWNIHILYLPQLSHSAENPCWNPGAQLFFWVFLGIKGADEDELKEIASAPHSKHMYNVPNFDRIQEVQKKIIGEVCSGVDEQLSSLVSGEECE